MAPGAAIYAIKVLDRMGKGNTRLVVSALKWLISNYEKMNIRISNISVRMLASARREEQEELLAAIEAVWDAGIVVVAAAGNNGPKDKSITIPGLCRKIITVGSSDDEDGEVKNLGLMRGYSGRGPTEACIMKPEVVAPGTAIVSCKRMGNGYEMKSGTSMATPVVAGAVAVLLSRYSNLKCCMYCSCFVIPVKILVTARLFRSCIRNWQGKGCLSLIHISEPTRPY